MKKAHLVFIPSPGVGHLVSAVEFSRRLLARDARLSITILAMTSPFPTSTSLPQTSSTPSTTDPDSPEEPHYIFLPQADLPPKEVLENSIEEYISKFAASHSHHVRTALLTLQESSPDRVRFHLVVDMFCTSLIDVGKDLGIPSYLFLTSGAAFLSLLLHLPERFLRTGVPRFDESEPEIAISGFQNPVPSSALPEFAFNTSGYTALMSHANKLEETNGLIINTFAELEPFAIKSLREVYDDLPGTESEIKIQRFRPPLFTVGPVLDLKGQARRPGDASQESKIMKWLDAQLEASVVFLCFGSVGAFSEEQVKEIANGLTQSGQRFLWSLRRKTTTGAKRPIEYTDAELKSALPKEFWGAVEGGRGLVCGWAPQVEIMAHKAIGSFVSHCGWNSTLESVWFGKPIVAWPLYAEQPSNAFELVNGLGLAAAWLGYGGKAGDLVTADEVERAVRSVMDSDNPVRSRAKEMSEASKSALLNGGSSFDSIGCLIRKIIGDEL